LNLLATELHNLRLYFEAAKYFDIARPDILTTSTNGRNEGGTISVSTGATRFASEPCANTTFPNRTKQKMRRYP